MRSLLRAQLGQRINVEILEKALTLELTQFEDSELYDKLTRARREASSRPLSLVSQTFELGQQMITLVGYGALLAAFSPLALARADRRRDARRSSPSSSSPATRSGSSRWRTPETREQLYLETVLAREDHAKEVKLFGLGAALPRPLQGRSSSELYDGDRAITIKRGFWGLVLGTIGSARVLRHVPVDRARRRSTATITLGAMTMYVLVFKQGQSALSSALGDVGGMYEDNLYLSNLYEFLDTPIAHAARRRRRGPDPARRRALRARLVRVPGLARARARRRHAAHPARQQARDRRRERPRQDHADQAAHAALRADRAARSRSTASTCASGIRTVAAPPHRRHLPGLRALPAHGRREHRRRRRPRLRRSRALGRRRRAAASPTPFIDAHARRLRHAARHAGSRTATSCRSGSGRRSRSRARSCARTPTSSCSTSRPPRWTPRPR